MARRQALVTPEHIEEVLARQRKLREDTLARIRSMWHLMLLLVAVLGVSVVTTYWMGERWRESGDLWHLLLSNINAITFFLCARQLWLELRVWVMGWLLQRRMGLFIEHLKRQQ